MNRIILIGNGFDLAHGLNTSYKDFMNSYWKDFAAKIPNHFFGSYEDELVRFERISGPASSYEAQMATSYGASGNFKNEKGYRYHDAFGKGIIPDICNALKDINSYDDLKLLIVEVNDASDLKFNLSFKNKFFEHISEKTTCPNTWLDIENEYYEQLKICAKSNDIKNLEKLNVDFENIKQKLGNYLSEIQKGAISTNVEHK